MEFVQAKCRTAVVSTEPKLCRGLAWASGGPFWNRKDEGAWTIPKGLIAPGERPEEAALREFVEENGHRPQGDLIPLGSARQAGGKVVNAWAVRGNWDAACLQSNTFEMEWPPRSGRRQSFPELDRAEWFSATEARFFKILNGQATFIDRLLQSIGASYAR